MYQDENDRQQAKQVGQPPYPLRHRVGEAFVPGFGFFGISGIVALPLGSLMLFDAAGKASCRGKRKATKSSRPSRSGRRLVALMEEYGPQHLTLLER